MLLNRPLSALHAGRLLGIACATMLTTSCATPTTPVEAPAQAKSSAIVVDRAAAPKEAAVVPCLALAIIVYHAPQTHPEVDQWLAGDLVDSANRWDRPDTVDSIRKHNAVVRDRCPGK